MTDWDGPQQRAADRLRRFLAEREVHFTETKTSGPAGEEIRFHGPAGEEWVVEPGGRLISHRGFVTALDMVVRSARLGEADGSMVDRVETLQQRTAARLRRFLAERQIEFTETQTPGPAAGEEIRFHGPSGEEWVVEPGGRLIVHRGFVTELDMVVGSARLSQLEPPREAHGSTELPTGWLLTGLLLLLAVIGLILWVGAPIVLVLIVWVLLFPLAWLSERHDRLGLAVMLLLTALAGTAVVASLAWAMDSCLFPVSASERHQCQTAEALMKPVLAGSAVVAVATLIVAIRPFWSRS